MEKRGMLFISTPVHEGPGFVNAQVPLGLELSLGSVISIPSPGPFRPIGGHGFLLLLVPRRSLNCTHTSIKNL